jgi:hypothetical protein
VDEESRKKVEVDLAGWQSFLSDVVIRAFYPNSQADLGDQLPRKGVQRL